MRIIFIFILIILILLLIYFYIIKINKKEFFSNIYESIPYGSFNSFYRLTEKNINNNLNIYNYQNNILKNNFKDERIASKTLSNYDIKNLFNKIKYKKSNNKYYEFDNLIDKIPEDIEKSNDYIRFISIISYLENILLKLLKLEINNNLKKYYCSSLESCYPSVVDRKIIKIEKSINSNDLRYTLTIEIILNNRGLSHIVGIISESIGNKIFINSVKLIGNRTSDEIFINNGYDKHDRYINIYSNSKIYNPNTYLNNSDETSVLFSNKLIEKLLKKKKRIDNNKYNFRCYGEKEALNIDDCEISTNLSNKIGKWDRLCKKNSECPFYKKNKNYPNNRGGCNDGWCEMPKGIEQISPRFYNKKKKPLCYNCINKNQFKCCNIQKNLKIYNNLKTPDYIFDNDIYDRTIYKTLLKNKNLKIS